MSVVTVAAETAPATAAIVLAARNEGLGNLRVLSAHRLVPPALARHVLGAYLQREPGQAEVRRLEAQCRLYRTLLKLWNLRVGGPEGRARTR